MPKLIITYKCKHCGELVYVPHGKNVLWCGFYDIDSFQKFLEREFRPELEIRTMHECKRLNSSDRNCFGFLEPVGCVLEEIDNFYYGKYEEGPEPDVIDCFSGLIDGLKETIYSDKLFPPEETP